MLEATRPRATNQEGENMFVGKGGVSSPLQQGMKTRELFFSTLSLYFFLNLTAPLLAKQCVLGCGHNRSLSRVMINRDG